MTTKPELLSIAPQKSLILNPYDGQTYDLAPFFKYISTEKTTFSELSNDCMKAADAIPQMIDPDQSSHIRDLQNILHLLTGLRDTFATIKKIN